MKNLEIARAFGMNVNEFTAFVGVSRQALRPGYVRKKRVKAMVECLRLKSRVMLVEEHAKADERAAEREKIIAAFERRMSGEGNDG